MAVSASNRSVSALPTEIAPASTSLPERYSTITAVIWPMLSITALNVLEMSCTSAGPTQLPATLAELRLLAVTRGHLRDLPSSEEVLLELRGHVPEPVTRAFRWRDGSTAGSRREHR